MEPVAPTSNQTPSHGRVVRIHLACRANLPIGSSLRVTGSHLWDPAGGDPNDPSDARYVSGIVGREAYSAGESGFAGGSLGMGASNVVNEDEAAVTGDGTVTPLGRDAVEPGLGKKDGVDVVLAGERNADKAALSGIHDSRAHWYASSVEMVTSPEIYPIWKTKRPVVLVLTDSKSSKKKSGHDALDFNEESQEELCFPRIFHHRYRYLVVTPGAETDSAHGLLSSRFGSENDLKDVKNLLHKTKISSAALNDLGAAGDGTMTSCDGDSPGSGAGWPVTLWENPFLPQCEDIRPNISTVSSVDSSVEKLSVFSEATSVKQVEGGSPRNFDLANLPYRTVDIDIASASVVNERAKSSTDQMDDYTAEYTDDGVLIDNWNGRDDFSYRSYLVREGLQAQKELSRKLDAEIKSEKSDIDNSSSVSLEIDCPTPKRRIFIVCYHLPVIVSKIPDTGEWQACWSESLLAKTENSSFVSAYDPHWVGTVTTRSSLDEADKEALRSLLATMNCTVLFFDEDIRHGHYDGFCKQVLWLAFHHVDMLDMRNPAFGFDVGAASIKNHNDGSLLELLSFWDQRHISQWWEAYNIVNRTFAVEVAKMIHPDDVVWVHDYHLSLLPRMLTEEERKISPRRTKIIFFLHIPFPVSMIFKEMECGESILEGILHADVVGFHGFTDARHFLSCAKRILGIPHESLEGGLIGIKYNDRTVVVTMSSVSIEPDVIDAAMQLSLSIEGESTLREKHSGRIIIAGLDVAQYLSGVCLKLTAYERLLNTATTWQKKLVLVQRCLIPGNRRLDEARTIREIRFLVKRIQSKFGDDVIDYEEVFGSSLPIDQRMALWKASDCLLNTEVRGGLNLWPLEFVYAQKGSQLPGLVIASEFSAVFSILNGALRISPFDMKLTLATIDKALTMSTEEREGRHLRDIEFVSSSSSDQWIQNVLRDLRDQAVDVPEYENDFEDEPTSRTPSQGTHSVASFLENEREDCFTHLNPKSVIAAYKCSSRRVFILDFNGTIVIKEAVDSFLKRDVIGSAGDAPPMDVIQSLEKICADPQNTVFVVSGDIKENVEKAIGGIRGLGLAASNGSCFSPPMKDGDSSRTWLALDLGVDWDSVKSVAIPIMSKFTARTNGSFIKVAHSSIGWSYYSCDPEFGSLQAKHLVVELEAELAAFEVRFVHLKGIVEVVPKKLNKGIIVKKILRNVAAENENSGLDFILCMGDDISDEKMFTSVFSFVSEMDEDYANVVPSPSVIPISEGPISQNEALLSEVPQVRCRNLNNPMFVFTVSVGKKETHAAQYVDDAVDVADLLVKIAQGSAKSQRWSLVHEEEKMFA